MTDGHVALWLPAGVRAVLAIPPTRASARTVDQVQDHRDSDQRRPFEFRGTRCLTAKRDAALRRAQAEAGGALAPASLVAGLSSATGTHFAATHDRRCRVYRIARRCSTIGRNASSSSGQVVQRRRHHGEIGRLRRGGRYLLLP
jgi:hypothetical protein